MNKKPEANIPEQFAQLFPIIESAVSSNATLAQAYASVKQQSPGMEIKEDRFIKSVHIAIAVANRIRMELQTQIDALQATLQAEQEKSQANVTHSAVGNSVTKPIDDAVVTHLLPKHFHGWIIGSHKGFIKLHKRVNGKVRSIYIGKEWNEARAIDKINAIVGSDIVTQELPIQAILPPNTQMMF